MADSSETPDVEVNIPLPGGLKVSGDEPYHILVVDDYLGAHADALAGPLAEGVVAVTPETFDDILTQAAPNVSYKATDPVAGGKAMAEIRLRFENLKAFKPEALAEQLPETKSLMEARRQVVARMRAARSAEGLAGAVGPAAAQDSDMA
ncbi:MAG: type VI secretion system contractile sheath small subunit, partial [bacterium]|nr:type VI secretion system contractile sheath small subunit [bacterium]